MRKIIKITIHKEGVSTIINQGVVVDRKVLMIDQHVLPDKFNDKLNAERFTMAYHIDDHGMMHVGINPRLNVGLITQIDQSANPFKGFAPMMTLQIYNLDKVIDVNLQYEEN